MYICMYIYICIYINKYIYIYDGTSSVFPVKTSMDQSIVELPICTVCLRRIQWSVSGVEGGNDVPVSMWFRGNTGTYIFFLSDYS
jgi:hypothetical protein